MSDAVEGSVVPTEQRHPGTADLDRLDTLEVLRRINDEDAGVAGVVRATLPTLAEVVEAAAARLRAGGRVHYFGAGTSGRLAAADAAELRPTFSLAEGRVIAHLAGGNEALTRSVEGAEDDRDAGGADAASVADTDVAIGLAASGRTPYVHGALQAAAEAGAATALISANPNAPIAEVVDWHVCAPTGPEVVAGSTRMKAGTAQKLLLGAFSTAVMVRLGKTYSNLMVDVVASNEKLRRRTVAILVEASGSDEATCREALAAAGGDLKAALVALLADVSASRARAALDDHGDDVRRALAALDPRP